MIAFQVCIHYAYVIKGCGDLKAKIRASICANKKLYEDILLYKVSEHTKVWVSLSLQLSCVTRVLYCTAFGAVSDSQ